MYQYKVEIIIDSQIMHHSILL